MSPPAPGVPDTPATPTLDVIVPAYGDGPLLRAAVRSVLEQTAGGWHLTLVDDGPPAPGLEAWLGSLDDPRVSYLHNPRTLGINRNFQRCVDLATADLVVILGADDLLLPSYVGLVTEAAAVDPAVTMVQPGVRVVDADGRLVRPTGDRLKALLTPRVRGRRVLEGERLAVSLLRGNWMYFPAVTFRRGPLQAHGFRPGYDVVQDLDLYLRLLLDDGRLLLLEEVAFAYRRHASSVSSVQAATGRRFAEERAFFAATSRAMAEHGWPRAARAADRHLTSRLHAVTRVPGAAAARDLPLVRALARHATTRRAG